jgi:hypothetical protein
VGGLEGIATRGSMTVHRWLAIPWRLSSLPTILLDLRMQAFHRAACSKQWIAAAAMASGLVSGCAAPSGPSWANFEADKALEAAAADDSFPSAAEAGLAATDKPAPNGR